MTTATAPQSDKQILEVYPKQGLFIASQKKFTGLIGGIGSGKSMGGVIKAYDFMSRHPGSLGMITAPTFPMLRDATLRTILEVFPENLITHRIGDWIIQHHNGSEVILRPTTEPDSLRGPNLSWFYMDEAALSPFEAFQILQGRIRQPGYPHRGWITTTPKGFNWVYQEFAREKREDYEYWNVAIRDNTFLDPDYADQLERDYSAQLWLQEGLGLFVVVGATAFFDGVQLKHLLDDTMPPVETRKGDLIKIWQPRAVGAKYVAGGDVAWGQKGAYSCVVILDYQTGVQVAEIHGRPNADELAEETVKLCREYNDAYLGIEENGEGIHVVNKCISLGYGHRMYYRDGETTNRDGPQKPGWHTDERTRPVLLGELEEATRGLLIRPRCEDAVREMMTFERNENGKPEAIQGSYSDHVFALGIAWQMRKHARYTIRKTSTTPRTETKPW